MTQLKLFLVKSEQANPIDMPVSNEVGETNETESTARKEWCIHTRTF